MKLKLKILFATALVLGCSGYASATVSLPWQNTYNCSAWTSGTNPNCNGLTQWGTWGDYHGDLEQITSAANNPAGTAGSSGQRHWSDAPDGASGGTAIGFSNVGNELWIRFYIRFQQGFTWSQYMGAKILYFMDSQAGGNQNYFQIGENWDSGQPYNSTGAVDYDTQMLGASSYHYTANVGFDKIWGNPSNGSWHCFEIYLKNNTSGQSNGVYRFWLDGTLQANYTNVVHGAWPGGFVIGSNNKYLTGGPYYTDFDDFSVTSTTPSNRDAAGNAMIGPIGWNGTSMTAPANLKLTGSTP